MAWQAVASDAAATWARIERIAERLSAVSPTTDRLCHLMEGEPGRALFFAYLDRARPGRGHADRARAILERAVEHVGDVSDAITFYGGFPGVAWTIEHLGELLAIGPDANDAVDEALLELLSSGSDRVCAEWVAGVTGWAIYALERDRVGRGREVLEAIVGWLRGAAESFPDGTTWPCPPWMPFARESGRTVYPVGVAHGAAGPLVILAAAAARGIADARELASGVARWIIAQHPMGVSKARFPAIAGESMGRLAWCEGDPGTATALVLAGDLLNEPTWSAIGHDALGRLASTSALLDPGLCHGRAGIAHVLQRWAARSPEPDARRAADAALARISIDCDEPGLLLGASGVGLVLLASVSDVAPDWDRALLMSA